MTQIQLATFGLAPSVKGQMLLVRSDGTLAFTEPMAVSGRAWGVDPVNSSAANTAALQAAITQAAINTGKGDGISPAGIIDLPAGVVTINAAALTKFGVSLHGVSGRGGTTLKADVTGNFTNGSRSAYPAMLKWDGGDQWAHGVQVIGINFDTSNIAGLGAAWFQDAGEGFLLDDVSCNSTAATPRTVNDAQITIGSKIVTFTSSTVTEDDVNALIQAGVGTAFFPANTKIDQINYANDQVYPPQATATSITLSQPATANGANIAFTINRPTDAFRLGGGATGRLGFINGVDNSGALVRIETTSGSTWKIGTLSGDGNGGGLLRLAQMATAGDPASVVVEQIKSENNSYNPKNLYGMDPVVLLDRCATFQLDILGGSFLTTGGREVVRIDQPQTTAQSGNGPSIYLHGVEGANPFNTQYTNIIRDSSTGELIASSPLDSTPAYPDVLWNRLLRIGRSGGLRSVLAANGVLLANKLLSADANNAFQVGGDGKLQWGPGAAGALDTNLYRTASGKLKSDGSLALAGAGAVMDLTAVSGASAASGTQTGDKIALYGAGASAYAVGLEASRLVAAIGSGGAFAVRPASGSGDISSGADAVVLWPSGEIQGVGLVLATAARTYGVTVTPDAAARWNTIAVTNNTAFTIAAPLNPPDSTHTTEMTIEVSNGSGGAMGVITWNAAFAFAGFVWANPANTKKRFARFEWNGTTWICTGLATADY